MSLLNIYDRHYKKLLIIPLVLFILAIAVIANQISQTGDFVNKGVSIAGGLTVTIPGKTTNTIELQDFLKGKFPGADITVRDLKTAGQKTGLIIDASDVGSGQLITALEEKIGKLEKEDYTVEEIGSALGQSFFKQTIRALITAFIAMGWIVFLYFGINLKSKLIASILSLLTIIFIIFIRNPITDLISIFLGISHIFIFIKYSIPSLAVVLSAFSDIIITLAIFNLFGFKLSTAGIAAFLMLIGYSVDTDILLSTRVLKRKEGTVFDRVCSAMKTGLVMSVTTISALIIALIFAQSDVLKQIMIILLIGLAVDLISTWFQNAGILRLYMEKKHKE